MQNIWWLIFLKLIKNMMLSMLILHGNTGNREVKIRGMAKQHYSTMSTDDICDLPVRNIATDEAILFMWATFPNIIEAIEVMKSWGFHIQDCCICLGKEK